MANNQPVRLGEVIAINPERRMPKGEPAPFVGMDCLSPFQRAIARYEIRVFTGSGSRFANGDTLLARITPCIENGKTAYVNVLQDGVNANGSTEFIVLSGITNVSDNRFVYYLSRSESFRDYVIKRMEGTSGRQRIPNAAVSGYELKLPSFQQQKCIGQILGTLDDKIELNRRTNETLEAMAKALFNSWFVDFDPVREKAAGRKPAGLDADTARLFPSAFEDSPLGKVPKGWRAVPLPVAIEVNPTRSMSKGIVAPYLEMGNMPTASARAIAWENREYGSGMRFINGDTLVARITPCLENGKTAYVDFLADGQIAWGSTEYIVLRSKPPLPTTFSYFLARTGDFRSHVIKNMTGTSGRQRAPAECLDKFMVIVPDAKVADRFGEFADGCLALMKQNDEESATLAATRDTLLPKLLSGELVA